MGNNSVHLFRRRDPAVVLERAERAVARLERRAGVPQTAMTRADERAGPPVRTGRCAEIWEELRFPLALANDTLRTGIAHQEAVLGVVASEQKKWTRDLRFTSKELKHRKSCEFRGMQRRKFSKEGMKTRTLMTVIGAIGYGVLFSLTDGGTISDLLKFASIGAGMGGLTMEIAGILNAVDRYRLNLKHRGIGTQIALAEESATDACARLEGMRAAFAELPER